MEVIKKIKFQSEEIASVKLVQKVMLQACDELGNNSCLQCPFYQRNGDGVYVCIEDLIQYAIEEMEGNNEHK